MQCLHNLGVLAHFRQIHKPLQINPSTGQEIPLNILMLLCPNGMKIDAKCRNSIQLALFTEFLIYLYRILQGRDALMQLSETVKFAALRYRKCHLLLRLSFQFPWLSHRLGTVGKIYNNRLFYCFTLFRQVFLHARKILRKRSRLFCPDWIDIQLHTSEIHLFIMQDIKKIILPLRPGKRHHHIKVRVFVIQTSAPAPGYNYILNLSIQLILVYHPLYPVAYRLFYVRWSHSIHLLRTEQTLRIWAKVLNDLLCRFYLFDFCQPNRFRFFHKLLIVHTLRNITLPDITLYLGMRKGVLCLIIDWLLQFIRDFLHHFTDTHIRIVIHAAIQKMIPLIIDGIIVSLLGFLDADIAVPKLIRCFFVKGIRFHLLIKTFQLFFYRLQLTS